MAGKRVPPEFRDHRPRPGGVEGGLEARHHGDRHEQQYRRLGQIACARRPTLAAPPAAPAAGTASIATRITTYTQCGKKTSYQPNAPHPRSTKITNAGQNGALEVGGHEREPRQEHLPQVAQIAEGMFAAPRWSRPRPSRYRACCPARPRTHWTDALRARGPRRRRRPARAHPAASDRRWWRHEPPRGRRSRRPDTASRPSP